MTTCMINVHLAVAGKVVHGVLFCAVLIPTRSGTELSTFSSVHVSHMRVYYFNEFHNI